MRNSIRLKTLDNSNFPSPVLSSLLSSYQKKKWVQKFYILEEKRITCHDKKNARKNRYKMKNEIILADVLCCAYIGKVGKVDFVFEVCLEDKKILLKSDSMKSSVKWVNSISRKVNEQGERSLLRKFSKSDSFADLKFDGRTGRGMIRRHTKRKKKGSDDFVKKKMIGKGTYGVVYLCEEVETGKNYAMKVLQKEFLYEKDQVKNTLMELKILSTLHHPFLMNVNYAYQTNNHLYIILDFVNGGELFYHLERSIFDEERVQFYAAEILLALEYLHEHNIVYRDLKAENVLIQSSGHIVLTDFGLSTQIIDGRACTGTAGTLEYMSPEVIKEMDYAEYVDWWSFGILIYEMIDGEVPFNIDGENYIKEAILFGEIQYNDSFSENAVSLISQLTEKDLDERLINPETIKKHPFFNGINWNSIAYLNTPPPFIPDLVDSRDISMIDRTFLDMSIDSASTSIYDQKNDEFKSFYYCCEESKTASITV